MEGWTKISMDTQDHLTDLSELIATVTTQLRIVRSQHEALRSQLSEFENEWIDHAVRTSSAVIEYQDSSQSPTPESTAGRRWKTDPLRLRRWSRTPDESVGTTAWFHRLTLASQSLGSSMTMMTARACAVVASLNTQYDITSTSEHFDAITDEEKLRRRRRYFQGHVGERLDSRPRPSAPSDGPDVDSDQSKAIGDSGLLPEALRAGHRRCMHCQDNLYVTVEETDKWLCTIERALSLAASNSQKSSHASNEAVNTSPEARNNSKGDTAALTTYDSLPAIKDAAASRQQDQLDRSESTVMPRRKPLRGRDTGSSVSNSSLTTIGTPSMTYSIASSISAPSNDSRPATTARRCPVCKEQDHPTSDICRGADKEAVTPNLMPIASLPSQSSISLPESAPGAGNSTFDLTRGASETRRSPSVSDLSVGAGGPMPEVLRKSRGREALERRMGIER
jgi:hypothetical protein